MAAVAYAAAAWPSGARPVPLPARRPFGGRLLTSQGVAQGWHVLRRPASPSGDRPGSSGGGGGGSGSDPPPTSSDGGGGASGGSWGASVLGVIAKHPSEALTCIVTSITGGYVFMWWRELKSVRKEVRDEAKQTRKEACDEAKKTRKYIRKKTKLILQHLGSAAQSGARGDSGAGASVS